jgi:antitoxin CptB
MTDARLRRLHIRAWRRGTKEMDLILGGYVDALGPAPDPARLDRIEALMEESDIDLYAWITGRTPPPDVHAALVSDIAAHAAGAATG